MNGHVESSDGSLAKKPFFSNSCHYSLCEKKFLEKVRLTSERMLFYEHEVLISAVVQVPKFNFLFILA